MTVRSKSGMWRQPQYQQWLKMRMEHAAQARNKNHTRGTAVSVREAGTAHLFELCVRLCRHHQVALQCCTGLMQLLPESGCCLLNLQSITQ